MNDSDPLMNTITDMLEQAPHTPVPQDFAQRVLARVPQPRARKVPVSHLSTARYGRAAILAAMLLLLVTIVVLAPATSGSNLWLTLQAVLVAELAALVLWFGWLRHQA